MFGRPFVDLGTTDLTRKTGGAHLFLAGAVNVVTGALLSLYAYTNDLLAFVVDNAGWYVTPATVLRHGRTLTFLATDIAFLTGIALLCLGAISCFSAWTYVLHGRSRRRGFVLAICNGCNPLALPLAFISAVLISVERTDFGEETTVS